LLTEIIIREWQGGALQFIRERLLLFPVGYGCRTCLHISGVVAPVSMPGRCPALKLVENIDHSKT